MFVNFFYYHMLDTRCVSALVVLLHFTLIFHKILSYGNVWALWSVFLRNLRLHIHLHTHWSWMHWSFIHSCILKFLHYHYYAIRTHIWWSKTWKAYLLHAIYYIVSHIHSFSVSFNIFLVRRQNYFSFKFVPLTRKKLFLET